MLGCLVRETEIERGEEGWTVRALSRRGGAETVYEGPRLDEAVTALARYGAIRWEDRAEAANAYRTSGKARHTLATRMAGMRFGAAPVLRVGERGQVFAEDAAGRYGEVGGPGEAVRWALRRGWIEDDEQDVMELTLEREREKALARQRGEG